MNELRVDGKTVAPKVGWTQLGPKFGTTFHSRLGHRLEGETDDLVQWNGDTEPGMGPRSILTLRFNAGIPQPFYFADREASDFQDGGLSGVDLCGSDGDVALHDAIMARCPVSLVDVKAGKNRALATIATNPGGYNLTRSAGDPSWDPTPGSMLPEYGRPRRMTYDGQHLSRAIRVALRFYLEGRVDTFMAMDLAALCHDAALAWNRTKAQSILDEPGGKGSEQTGREYADVLILAAITGNKALLGLLKEIAKHVVDSRGFLHSAPMIGNPPPKSQGEWASDRECHETVVGMRLAGWNREALKLAESCVGLGRVGKYILKSDPRVGDQAPTDGTAWAAAASGVFPKSRVRTIASKIKVGPWPNGSMSNLSANPLPLLIAWGQRGKTRTMEAALAWSEI
jgi:hypothetical protein